MKRIINSIAVGVLAVCGAVSCTQDNIDARYNPDKATAPALGEIADCVLDADGDDITFTYNEADFKVATSKSLVLYADKSADMADMKRVSTKTLANGEGAITQRNMNSLILGFGAEFDTPTDVYFMLVANLADEKGQVYNPEYELRSNVVKATFTPYAPPASAEHEKVWVLGDFNGWSHQTAQHLYDYADAGNKVYTGVIDFEDKAVNGFKITGAADWSNDTGNWGIGDTAPEAEAASFTMANNGGDIKVYSMRYYLFSLNAENIEAPVLTKVWGADFIGIIGFNDDWDNDIEMTLNTSKGRFYADIEAENDTQIKFRGDHDWTIDYGQGDGDGLLSKGGANIPVPAGNYRVYFNPAEGTYELSVTMYGKDEAEDVTPDNPSEPETPADAGYGLVGEHNGWGGGDDKFEASPYPGVLVTTANLIGAYIDQNGDKQGGFKVRYYNDGTWSWDLGTENGDTIELDTKVTLAEGASNIFVAESGEYDVYFFVAESAIMVVKAGDTPEIGDTVGLVGQHNDWGGTPDWVFGYDDAEQCYILKNAELKAGESFKIRKNNTWDDSFNYGTETAGNVEIGAATALICGGGSQDMSVAEDGTYDLWFYVEASTLYVMNAGEKPSGTAPADPSANGFGLVGDHNGWGSSDDTKFTEHPSILGALVATQTLEAGKGFKIRYYNDGDWTLEGNFGRDGGEGIVAVGEPATLVNNGGNLQVAESGTYDIYFYPASKKVYIAVAGSTPDNLPAMPLGLIGDFNGWGGDELFDYDEAGGYYVLAGIQLDADKGFKCRYPGTWDDRANYGLESDGYATVGAATKLICAGGSKDIKLASAGTYDLYVILGDEIVLYVMNAGEKPAL